jgi:LysM repeat protein
MSIYYEAVTCPAGAVTYTLRPGDTFYTIAQRLGTTVTVLSNLNSGINPSQLHVGQQICVPGRTPPTPQVIPTPFCSSLQPVFSSLPSNVIPPFGAVEVHAVSMSTRVYTIYASPLPNPTVFGNFNSYVGVLSLIQETPTLPQAIISVPLVASPNGTWSGTTSSLIPVVGDFAEIRPVNRTNGRRGAVILRGNFTPCRT